MHTPRMTKTALLALLLVVAVVLISPQQLPVIVYKLGLVLLAGVAGYILDRGLFPYARPDAFKDSSAELVRYLFIAAQVRRAVIVAAAMLAVGLGL